MIYVTGDTHGDFSRFRDKRLKALKKGDHLIICGDFGFIWDGSPAEAAILKKIGSMKFTTLFIDGCHENFDLLMKYEEEDFCGGRARNICGNLYHLSRGHIFDIEGRKIFAFGGGQSPEAEIRRESRCYWEQELPTALEIGFARCILSEHGGEADYIITHEPPFSIKQFLGFEVGQVCEFGAYLDSVRKEVKYRMWYFGKVHKNKLIPPSFRSVFDDIIPLE